MGSDSLLTSFRAGKVMKRRGLRNYVINALNHSGRITGSAELWATLIKKVSCLLAGKSGCILGMSVKLIKQDFLEKSCLVS